MFRLQMGFSFPFLRANDLRLSLLNIRARSFYSLVHRGWGTYARLVYNWYQNIFHAIAVLVVFHAANGKPEEKNIKTRLQIKKGKSKCCCRHQTTWLIIAPLSPRCRTAIATLSLRICSAVAPLSFCCCSAAVAPAVATQSHR